MVARTKKLTPDQLRMLLDELLKLYSEAYANKNETPHYEHIKTGNRRVKVGYHFDNPNPNELISIRIIDKGEA